MNGPETFIFRGSSNLSEATFDPDTDTLTITFQNGDEYDYLNVSMATYRALTQAGSAGEFFHRSIKSRYPCDGPK